MKENLHSNLESVTGMIHFNLNWDDALLLESVIQAVFLRRGNSTESRLLYFNCVAVSAVSAMCLFLAVVICDYGIFYCRANPE